MPIVTQNDTDAVVLTTGYAKLIAFDDGIIIGKEDMYRAYQFAPNAQIIGVQMDTVNHGTLSKAELRRFIEERHLDKQRALVPDDGQRYHF